MSVSVSLQNIATFARVHNVQGTAPSAPRTPPVSNHSVTDLQLAQKRLVGVFQALQELSQLMGVPSRLQLDLPDAQSSPGLALDLTSAPATLNSIAEINASPHSFSPFGPAWSGTSTAPITIGGEYDGSDGTGTISFESRRTGVHGVNNLRIRVRDPLDNIIANLNIAASHAEDREYDLENGLFLTLGAGLLVDDETTSIQVYENVGSAVDPDLPLNGIRNQNPNFQYYPEPDTLAPIVDGTFALNGETINVSAGGTLNDVVDSINGSAAGVTATFNAVTERIEVTQNTEGSVPSIVITGDTSNFIAATKLDGAIVTPGIDPESEKIMTDVGAFAGVSSGSFLINGTSIAVDPGADSLIDVVDGINTSGAGVSASFNETTQRVLIEDNAPATFLEIDSNGTGLFAALNIPEGRVDPTADSSGVSPRRTHDIADRLESILSELNFLFRDSSFQDGASHAGGFRASLESAVQSLFGEGSDRTRSLHGIRFDYRNDARTNGDFASLDRQRFVRDIQVRGDSVKDMFASNSRRTGIIDGLMDAAHQALKDISQALGQSGTLIDRYA